MKKDIKLHPLHVKGKYYVDFEDCTCMGACEFAAPNNFTIDEIENTSYISKQPETPEEVDEVQEAMMCCALEAIHDDGEEL